MRNTSSENYLSMQYSTWYSDVDSTKETLISPFGVKNLLFIPIGSGFLVILERKNHGGEFRLLCCIQQYGSNIWMRAANLCTPH